MGVTEVEVTKKFHEPFMVDSLTARFHLKSVAATSDKIRSDKLLSGNSKIAATSDKKIEFVILHSDWSRNLTYDE